MDAIFLKRKADSTMGDSDIVVFDEIIKGVLTSEWFVPVFTGAHQGMRIITLSYLIENYRFPEKEGHTNVRFLRFLKGANPELMEQVELYQTDEIEI